jgi:hypothetical protein
MARIKCFLILLGMAAITRSVVWTAGPTLVELARRTSPNPVLIERMRELVPVPIELIISRADLIVHGTVTPLRTYLSDDQREVFTEYQVTPARTLFQRSVPQARAPGAAAPVVLTIWGGRTVLEGVEVVLKDRDAPVFEAASEYVLFMTENEARPGAFRLVTDVAGVLGVVDGRVQMLSKDNAYGPSLRALQGLTVDQLDVEVRQRTQR